MCTFWSTHGISVINSVYSPTEDYLIIIYIVQAKFHISILKHYFRPLSICTGSNCQETTMGRQRSVANISFLPLFLLSIHYSSQMPAEPNSRQVLGARTGTRQLCKSNPTLDESSSTCQNKT